MSLSSFSLASLRNLKKAKSMFLYPPPEIEIDTSYIKQIGNYRLGEEIGSGAFGKVILGLHIITGEKVAIKILDKIILSQTPEDYELVKQELSILKIVKHKHIVQLYEILETPQHIFIIMEYCEGQDIMDYILTRGRLSEKESLKYFQQLINALFYLHSQNITHRDIKIDNLLLDRNLDLKLIDFGLSTKYRDDRLLSQPCGTVVYAAPEVLDCKEYHGMLADVWSSGIVLFGMLSGFLPFGDPDDEVNKKLVLQGNIEIPKFFSREVTDLLRHMLDINPLTRYTLEEIMAHPWFNKSKFSLIPGIIIGINRIPIDEKIVNLCVTYNADKDKVRNSVINNKFNTESALYYLLVKKLRDCGNESISDLCSNKFIKYILEETNRIDYINQLQDKIQTNNKLKYVQNGLTKEKLIDNDRIKIISQLNDYIINYNYNFNGKENDFNLSAAPELVNDNQKKYNYNLINIENNYTSNNNSIEYDEYINNSDIMNMNNRNNPSLDESKLIINLEESEFNKKDIEIFEGDDYEKNLSITEKLFPKEKLEQKEIFHKNKDMNYNRYKNRIINLEENDYIFNKSAYNNKRKVEKYIYYKGQNNKLNENVFKNNFNKKKQSQQPLTSRNESNKSKSKINESSYYKNINYTQFSNIKNNSKIVPIPKEFYKKINIKNINKENKDNIKKIIYKQKNIQNKEETLIKDITKRYLKKSKISKPLVNIPPLNINNNKNKVSYKKINNKRKHLNTNIYETPNEIYKKYISNFNKSNDNKNKLNTQRNNELNNNLLKNIYKENQSNTINNDKILLSSHQNNIKKFFENKLNSKSNETRKKFLLNSLSKEKNNKSKVMNLFDNFHLYQRAKKTYNSNHLNNSSKNNSNFNNSNINKNKLNKTSDTNNNRLTYNKKDLTYIQSPILTFENSNNQFNDDLNNNNGFNTDRTRNIFNLKKQSCFDKDNNNHIKYNNKIKLKKKINNFNDNIISHLAIKTNQNDFIKIKIKDYYIKGKKLDNSNKKNMNDDSYSIYSNKLISSMVRTNLNNNLKNYINSSSIINTDKNNTSRINVTLRNKSIKDKNLDKIYKKMNNSISSSNNKFKHKVNLKGKILNSKNYSIDENNKFDSLSKVGFVPNYKIRSNFYLSKEKNKNQKESNNNQFIKKTQHLESSVIVYKKKSPYKIRDLSDSPKQKYLNEKTRNNRIPWKIKKKGIDDKLDSLSIYNRYINQLKNSNPFKKGNLLKKKFKNNKKEKNTTYFNNSKIKINEYSFIPNSSNRKTLNVSLTNYDKNNNLFEKDKENNSNINKLLNQNVISQDFYKNGNNKILNSYNMYNIVENNNNNISINKNKEITTKNPQMKQGKKIKILKIRKRNEPNLNYNYEKFLTQVNENNTYIKDNNEFHITKNMDKNNKKKKLNNSISFGSLYSLNGYEKNNINNNDIEFEDPFDLSCLFITNRKINECINIIGTHLKKYGINLSIKKNIINCFKNNYECQISVNKLINGINCLLNYDNIICYKAIDKKSRNNKIIEIFSKLILINN